MKSILVGVARLCSLWAWMTGFESVPWHLVAISGGKLLNFSEPQLPCLGTGDYTSHTDMKIEVMFVKCPAGSRWALRQEHSAPLVSLSVGSRPSAQGASAATWADVDGAASLPAHPHTQGSAFLTLVSNLQEFLWKKKRSAASCWEGLVDTLAQHQLVFIHSANI